jgi:AbrB family looped-hinge helix DNA binding protein
MSDKSSVVTRKGQITIPAEVRRKLGLRQGDRVEFRLDDGEVRLVRLASVAQRTAGIFRSEAAPLSAEELRRAAEVAIAEAAD